MKKVININFQGIVVPIEEDAYEVLQQYLESLRQYFAQEDGHEEIINDIETRISELFQKQLKAGATCITVDHVHGIINTMGRPEDFDDQDVGGGYKESEKEESPGAQPNWTYGQKQRLYRDENNKIFGGVCSGIAAYLGIDPWIVRILFIISGLGLIAYILLWVFIPSNSIPYNGVIRKLYRNPDDKVIAGVCGGIGSYFNVSSWIPRIVFLLPFVSALTAHWSWWWGFPHFTGMSFGSGAFLIYIILWMVVPMAKSTSEKLEMKGEKVDLNSIKESVSREMKDVGERVKKAGKDAGDYLKEKGPQMRREFAGGVSSSGSWIGNVIAAIFKIFIYIILGAVGFVILAVLFAVAVSAVAVFPLKDYIVASGWENVMAWFTLIFFVGVPLVGTITYIIRRILQRKSSTPYLRYTWDGLWIFGWICLFSLASMLSRDFKYGGFADEQNIELAQPASGLLEVSPVKYRKLPWKGKIGWGIFGSFDSFGVYNDTALIPVVRINVVKAPDSLYSGRYLKFSNGRSVDQANHLATILTFDTYQEGNTLYVDDVVKINTEDKFRNQFVDLAIRVPVGGKIRVNDGLYSRSGNRFFSIGGRRYDRIPSPSFEGKAFMFNTTYIMHEDGLHAVDPETGQEIVPGEPYRYQGPGRLDSLKKEQDEQIRSMERSMDSVKELQNKVMKQMQDSLLKQREEIDRKLQNMDMNSVSLNDGEDYPEWENKYLGFFMMM